MPDQPVRVCQPDPTGSQLPQRPNYALPAERWALAAAQEVFARSIRAAKFLLGALVGIAEDTLPLGALCCGRAER